MRMVKELLNSKTIIYNDMDYWVSDIEKLYKKDVIKGIILLLIIFVLCSCNYLCQLGTYEKDVIEKVERVYSKDIKLAVIPCESIYINCYIQSNQLDTLLIHKIHSELYNPIKGGWQIDTLLIHKIHSELYNPIKGGWQTMIIYDKKGNYLFDHHFTGKINRK
jgi:hypothetical protein